MNSKCQYYPCKDIYRKGGDEIACKECGETSIETKSCQISYYKPLEIAFINLAGLSESLIAMRLPKKSKTDSVFSEDEIASLGPSDQRLAKALVLAGPDHAKFTRGIIIWLKMKMQTGFMIEFETYRHGIECLSTSSSMHRELKSLHGEALASQKQKDLKDKTYTRILTISYQALRSIYRARRSHRHPDWQIFCDFIECLPFFDVFIYPEKRKKEKNNYN